MCIEGPSGLRQRSNICTVVGTNDRRTNGIPWWYFYKAGTRYDGRQLNSVDPGRAPVELHTAEPAWTCVRCQKCIVVISLLAKLRLNPDSPFPRTAIVLHQCQAARIGHRLLEFPIEEILTDDLQGVTRASVL